MNIHDILIKPILTEKSTLIKNKGYYSFMVHPWANKIVIKNAVEKIFKVSVQKCRVFNTKAKRKPLRTRRGFGITKTYKKAFVKLKGDARIAELDT